MTRSFRRPTILALAAVTLGAAVLRSANLSESLWLDELHSAWCVSGTWGEVLPRAAAGNHSPLYFYLLKLVVAVAGPTELALRAPSLVAGVLLVPVLFEVCRIWTRSTVAGLAATVLVTVDPVSTFFAQEARPYALVELLAVLQVHQFRALLSHPTRLRRSATIVGGALLTYLHFTAALLLVGELLALILLTWRYGQLIRYPWRAAAADGLWLLLLITPLIPLVVGIAGRRHLWDAVLAPATSARLGAAVLTYVALPAGLVVLSRGWWHRPDSSVPPPTDPRSAVLTSTWLGVPLAIVAAATATGWANLWLVRYLLAAWPAWFLSAALLFSRIAGRHLRPWLAAVGCAVAIAQSGWLTAWGPDTIWPSARREDWREAIAAVAGDERGQPLLLFPGLIEDVELGPYAPESLQAYCQFPVRASYSLGSTPRTVYALPTRRDTRLSDDQQQQLTTAQGGWLLVRGPLAEPLLATVRQQLEQTGVAVTGFTVQVYGNLTLVHVACGSRANM